jgi:hypothetical protein
MQIAVPPVTGPRRGETAMHAYGGPTIPDTSSECKSLSHCDDHPPKIYSFPA